MEKKTVVLATYGKTREHLHGACVDSLKHELGVLVLSTHANPQIDMARSLLACAALAHGADVALFVDSDILFDPLDVEVLANSAREVQGIVGAPYSKRKMGAGVVGSFRGDEVTFFEGGKRYAAPGAVGMGFTAIHRSVFERLDALPEYAVCGSSEGPMRPYFRKLIVNNYWLHEDASFCHAAREVGAGNFIDTSIRVKHLGDHPFGIEDCRRASVDEKSLVLRVRAE